MVVGHKYCQVVGETLHFVLASRIDRQYGQLRQRKVGRYLGLIDKAEEASIEE